MEVWDRKHNPIIQLTVPYKYSYELQIKTHNPIINENLLQNKFHWIVSFSLSFSIKSDL